MARDTTPYTRALIIGLKSPAGGKSNQQIEAATGVSARTINSIYARALERGFDPNQRPMVIEDHHVQNGPRTGRPSKMSDELKEHVRIKLSEDSNAREKTASALAHAMLEEFEGVSAATIARVIRKTGHKQGKPPKKPGPAYKVEKRKSTKGAERASQVEIPCDIQVEARHYL
jgi:transposase